MNKLIVGGLVLILLAGGFLFLTSLKKDSMINDKQNVVSPTPENKMDKTYTLDEIVKHNTNNNCWFAIEGKVYDVTSFISSGRHPGGDAILQGCGKDATVLFNTRPMGSGTPHSEKARELLKNFEIGVLASQKE